MSSSPSLPVGPGRLYHLELRHFPRNVCRFNVSGEELRATVLEPWAADRLFELGELRWDPRQARLTVIEGPRIPPDQLSMGRGWRTAQRQGQDVTEQLLAATAEALAGGADRARTPSPTAAREAAIGGPVGDPVADSLGLELLAQMASEQIPLPRAWEIAGARDPNASSSEALAVAERAVSALLRTRLVVLLGASAPGGVPQPLSQEEATSVLRVVESWTGASIWMRRA